MGHAVRTCTPSLTHCVPSPPTVAALAVSSPSRPRPDDHCRSRSAAFATGGILLLGKLLAVVQYPPKHQSTVGSSGGDQNPALSGRHSCWLSPGPRLARPSMCRELLSSRYWPRDHRHHRSTSYPTYYEALLRASTYGKKAPLKYTINSCWITPP